MCRYSRRNGRLAGHEVIYLSSASSVCCVAPCEGPCTPKPCTACVPLRLCNVYAKVRGRWPSAASALSVEVFLPATPRMPCLASSSFPDAGARYMYHVMNSILSLCAPCSVALEHPHSRPSGSRLPAWGLPPSIEALNSSLLPSIAEAPELKNRPNRGMKSSQPLTIDLSGCTGGGLPAGMPSAVR